MRHVVYHEVRDIRQWTVYKKLLALLLALVALFLVAIACIDAWQSPDGLWALWKLNPPDGPLLLPLIVFMACGVLFYVPYWVVYDGLAHCCRRGEAHSGSTL